MGKYCSKTEANHGRFHMKDGWNGCKKSGEPCKQCRYCMGIWDWEEEQLVQ